MTARPAERVLLVTIARVGEQGSLFLAALLLAKGIDPSEFAGAAALFILASAAMTMADLGCGLQRLRSPQRQVPSNHRRLIQASSGAGLAVALLGLALPSTGAASNSVSAVLLYGGLIWTLAAWMTLARGGAFRNEAHLHLFRGSLVGSLMLLAVCILGEGWSTTAVAGLGLLAKFASELVILAPWLAASSHSEALSWPVFGNQVLNYTATNVDAVIVGLVLGPAQFARYSLAFRLAGGIYSLAGHAITRMGTVRLASLSLVGRRRATRRWTTRFFAMGLVGTLVLVAGSGLIVPLLGPTWEGLPTLIAILALLLPFRMMSGWFVAVLLAQRADRPLLTVEVLRLVVAVPVLVLGASYGLVGLCWAVVAASAGSSLASGLLARRSLSDSADREAPPQIELSEPVYS